MSLVAEGLVGLLVVLVAMTAVWGVSVRMDDASIADLCWGPGFALLAWVYQLPGERTVRSVVLAVLVTIWGTRLAIHLARRHHGEDWRYAAMRAAQGEGFWWRSLFIVFWLQGALLWAVALPVLVASRAVGPPGVTVTDILGGALFLIGLAFETLGDYQLARFKRTRANRHKVLDTGLWRYTRHPNYFGDALLWWGIYIVAASTPGGWLTFGSPLLMTLLLLKVSGVTLLERTLMQTKPDYAAYAASTPSFFPWVPSRPRQS